MRLQWLLVAAVVTALPVQPAAASSCVNPKTVQITFAKGARCWAYTGDATHFSGRFAGGQRIIATSTGIATFGDGKSEWKTTGTRDVDVTGPSHFWADMDDTGDRPTILPRSGIYTFGFSPCAMWRAPGTFVICTR